MGSSKRVTLSDIAEMLDLSKVSISKALRDHPDISDETRELVQATARKVGYAPNRVARSLTLERTGTLGVILPKISHNFFADVLAGVNHVAAENDYEIVLCVSEENAELEQRYLRTLFSMQVDGLLISVSEQTSDPEPFLALQKQGLPIVFFDRDVAGIEASRVTVDDYGGAYKAVAYAIDNNHERIAHIAGFSHINVGRARRRGYEDALRDYKIAIREEWIIEGGFAEQDGYNGFSTLLEAEELPDAIFGVTFPVALGVADALRVLAPELQDEIQIYSFGQHGLNRFFKYPHVSVYQTAPELGRRATVLLLKQIQRPNSKLQHIELPTFVATDDHITDLPYLQGRTDSKSGSPLAIYPMDGLNSLGSDGR